jgi:hypothetical protein
VSAECYLARFAIYERGDMPPCDGRLVNCHLIPRQIIERRIRSLMRGEPHDKITNAVWAAIVDVRTTVQGCGGPQGNGGHHGMLDQSRTLRIPRDRLPAAVEEFAEELGLGWWLTREYGEPMREAA